MELRDEDESATRLLTTDSAGDILSEVEDAEPPHPRLIRAARWQVHSPRMIVFLAAFFKFCIVCSGMMLLVPLFRLIEDAICHGFFEDTSPDLLDEMKCKADGVQARLSTFLGWSGLVGSIVSTFYTLPRIFNTIAMKKC